MHRNNHGNASPHRHQHNFPMTASLIFTHQPYSPQNHTQIPKFKYDDFGFKKAQFQRHDSEKDFKKEEMTKPMPFVFGNEQLHEQPSPKHAVENIRKS
jgi:hypothetical protein